MSVRRELIKLIAFALVALAVLWLLWSTLLNVVSGETKSYVADFTDVSGLHEGDNVRIAGVRVGRVDALKLVDTHAEVTLTVQANQPVFENTRAVIRYQNLIGQRFVSLVPGPGAARPLPDGGRIPIGHTEPSFDLSALLNGFQPLFTVLQPADVNKLSDSIVAVLQGSGPEIDPLLDQTTQLTNSIADRDQIVGNVITNLNTVLDQLSGKGPELDSLIAQSRRLVDGLNSNTDEIFGSVERVREFTGNADDLISDIRSDVHTDVRNANRASETFVNAKGELDDTLTAFPTFLGGLARVTQYGSWLNLYACSITINIPPLPGIGTFPGDTHSEVCR
ncbi:MAG TPA: MCE family protein [Pseudonocardia sp.]|nr:MCE family protein [Pseudonocardia sp.]